MTETVRATLLNGKTVGFRAGFSFAVWEEERNQWISGPEGLFQTVNIIRLTVIEAVEWSDVKENFFRGNHFTIFVWAADGMENFVATEFE